MLQSFDPRVRYRQERLFARQTAGCLIRGFDATGPTKRQHLSDSEACREKDFTEVKAECRRYVQITVNMMDVVKTPEERDFVIGAMPIVKAEIHEEKASAKLQKGWQG